MSDELSLPDGTGHPHLAEDARVFERRVAWAREQDRLTWKDVAKASFYSVLATDDEEELQQRIRDHVGEMALWLTDLKRRQRTRPRPRGKCPVCHTGLALTQDGRVYPHLAGFYGSGRCKGSGQPAEVP